jgi:hypothetical protein
VFLKHIEGRINVRNGVPDILRYLLAATESLPAMGISACTVGGSSKPIISVTALGIASDQLTSCIRGVGVARNFAKVQEPDRLWSDARNVEVRNAHERGLTQCKQY